MVKVDEHKLNRIVLRLQRIYELSAMNGNFDIKQEAHEIILDISGLHERKKNKN